MAKNQQPDSWRQRLAFSDAAAGERAEKLSQRVQDIQSRDTAEDWFNRLQSKTEITDPATGLDIIVGTVKDAYRVTSIATNQDGTSESSRPSVDVVVAFAKFPYERFEEAQQSGLSPQARGAVLLSYQDPVTVFLGYEVLYKGFTDLAEKGYAVSRSTQVAARNAARQQFEALGVGFAKSEYER